MLEVTVNGERRRLAPGLSILQALHAAGIELPALCHDPRLRPAAGCRLCLVQLHGQARPVTACSTPLTDGMAIETHTPELEAGRRTLLALLARRYPRAAVEGFPDKPFHRWLRVYGIEPGEGEGDAPGVDDSHPYIHVDMARCILCYRCVRICDELPGQFVWHALGRGAATRIVPGAARNLIESPCIGCGACVDSCPSGALEDKTILAHGAPAGWTRTVCPYCGTGCELEAGVRDGRLAAARPVLESPVSKGHLCLKGRYAFDFVQAADRVTAPMIRRNGAWLPVSWTEAIAFAVQRLREIRERHGPDSIGVLGSARATNEENYLVQKFARVALGTHNVDCCARVCHTPSAAALKRMLGAGAATNAYDDIEHARTILVCGANPTENHPILGERIKQAPRRAAHLIVLDPRRIELAHYAELHLAPRPGTDIPLFNAMAAVIVAEQLHDSEFLSKRVGGFDEFREFIAAWTPERAGAITGVDPELIRRAARRYATARPALSVHGLGLTEHVQGTETVMALVNLALLTGNLGKPGTGINPLRGQNNVQGAAHMGCDPSVLPGGIALHEGRERCESVWGVPLPATAGLNLLQMMDRAVEGRLKALWVVGYDLYLTNADAAATARALSALELVVVQDLFLTETAREFAHVFLPVAASFEKDGTFMNAERRIQRVRRVLAPPGEARADWEILCQAAQALGHDKHFAFRAPEEIWNEVRALWPEGRGISYARLEQAGLQWPCPDEQHPGTAVLHAEAFGHGPRATLECLDYRPSPEVPSADYPLRLITGRTRYHFNAGGMTRRTANIELEATDVVQVSPHDAQRLGLRDGERVRLKSRYGEAVLPARVREAVKPGELFASFHDARCFLNRVTGPRRDRYVKTPEYKLTAVRLERL